MAVADMPYNKTLFLSFFDYPLLFCEAFCFSTDLGELDVCVDCDERTVALMNILVGWHMEMRRWFNFGSRRRPLEYSYYSYYQ
jgi:hypothetical protein